MSGRLSRMCLYGAFAVSLLSVPALADPGSSDSVARLEALLEAQQRKIEALEQQVAASAQADMDAARAEQMKQQIREVLSEAEFRESLMPSTLQAGYDGGFFIRSHDDKFKMKFNGLMQIRYTYSHMNTRNRYMAPRNQLRHDRSGIDGARIRFRVSGHVYNKDLTYLLELDMSQGSFYDARVNYAWVHYRFAEEFQIKAGIFRMHSTRADTESTATMQFVEYPVWNAIFGLARGTGISFWGNLADGKGRYSIDVVNAMGAPGRRTVTTDEALYANGHDNNPGVVFRTVWALMSGHCLHPDDRGNWTAPCDMAIHDEPALNMGFHYAFNEDWHDGSQRISFGRRTFFEEGGYGMTSSQQTAMHQLGVDAGFKYMGFSTTAEYAIRIINPRDAGGRPPWSPLFMASGQQSTVATHGAYVQCGYFLPIPGHERKFEVVGRVGAIWVAPGNSQGVWTYAVGANYYIIGHKVKLQTDFTKVTEAPVSANQWGIANVNDDALVWRVQLQVAF